MKKSDQVNHSNNGDKDQNSVNKLKTCEEFLMAYRNALIHGDYEKAFEIHKLINDECRFTKQTSCRKTLETTMDDNDFDHLKYLMENDVEESIANKCIKIKDFKNSDDLKKHIDKIQQKKLGQLKDKLKEMKKNLSHNDKAAALKNVYEIRITHLELAQVFKNFGNPESYRQWLENTLQNPNMDSLRVLVEYDIQDGEYEVDLSLDFLNIKEHAASDNENKLHVNSLKSHNDKK